MLKKILIGTGVIMVGLILSATVVVWMISSTNKPKASKEERLKGKNSTSKNALIIYQPSVSDVTSEMAHEIGRGLNDGGYDVTLNYPGEYLTTDISKYSIIVFGSPNYGGKPLSILTNYMSRIKDFSSNKIILFSTGSNIDVKDELEIMEKSLIGVKASKKVKFLASDKKESKKSAYELGMELSK